ncbi:MAG: hypothetical protein FWE50_04870 [Alphaproteobacteria bacterium]|nr:hypothetical protein [Alphaproteobacteria bacterium]
MENSIEDIIKKPTPGKLRLRPEQISSEVFVVAPTQINYIAEIFANSVADAMNMRAFAPKIRTLAEKSLRSALTTAKKQGA